jgi:hypothetical protein
MKKMRKAFSMIIAIFVIVVVAAIAALVLNLASRMTKTTGAQYYREQAALLARSYTELAVMAVINHNRNTANNCIEDIDGVVNGLDPNTAPGGSSIDGSGFDVQTRIYYIGNDLPCSQSRKLTDSTDAAGSATRVSTNYQDAGATDAAAGMIVDVYVRYKDPDAASLIGGAQAPWITYHRRTLQKL